MGTMMTVICEVDQVECIKLGIGVDSTVKIDVDLSTWTEAERSDLASRWNSGKVIGLKIYPPDVSGLLAAVRRRIEQEARWKANEERKNAEVLAIAIEAIRAGNDPYISPNTEELLPDDCKVILKERRDVWDKEKEERKAAREAREMADADAAIARKQRLGEQIKAFLPSAPGLLEARYAAGLADDNEVISAIRERELEAHGVKYTNYDEFMDCEGEVFSVTDEQFERLQEFIKKQLPQGVKIKIFKYVDKGDCEDEGLDEGFIVAEATWKVGEIEITANYQLSAL
jgi:hypothetical protein